MEYVPHNTPHAVNQEIDNRKVSNEIYFEYIAENDNFEIDSSRLQRQGPSIGSGTFGYVYLGLLDGKIKVAIKTAKMASECATVEERESQMKQRESLRAELRIFSNIGTHENVIKLLGAVTKSQKEFCIILEYCEHKGLDQFLKDRKEQYIDEIIQQMTSTTATQYKAEVEESWTKDYLKRRAAGHLTTSDLLSFALQSCRGVEFLNSKKILHRDLALRNVLLTQDFVVKLADFGLSRSTQDDRYIKHNNSSMLPCKWLPLEALLPGPTPLKSDFWTFGILLWEIFSFNDEPYDGMNAVQYIAYIDRGYRLERPTHSPMEIYELMLALWNADPELRPVMIDCQKIISLQLRRSCLLLAKHHDKKRSINTYENERVIWESNHLQLPDSIRKQSADTESMRLSPLFSEKIFQFGAPDDETTGFITTFEQVMTPISRKEFNFDSNDDEIRLPNVVDRKHQRHVCCTFRRTLLAAAVILLITLAATAVGVFAYQHMHSEEYGTTNVAACTGKNIKSLSKEKLENTLRSFALPLPKKSNYGHPKHKYRQLVRHGTVNTVPKSDGNSFTLTCQCEGNGVVCYLDIFRDEKDFFLHDYKEYRALNKGSGRYNSITSGSIECIDNGHYFLNESKWAKNVGMYACYTTTWVTAERNKNQNSSVMNSPSTAEIFPQISTTTATWNGSEYLVVEMEELWGKASYQCGLWGGHLVDIQSKEEHDFVYGIMKEEYREYWIGLRKDSGDLRWEDGSFPSYTSYYHYYIEP